MKAFVKTKSTEKVSIMGYEGDVDWSRDAVAVALIAASEKEKAAQNTPVENGANLLDETVENRIHTLKQIYFEAINKIIGDPKASETIFTEDDSLEVVSEVYEYLTAGYSAYRKRRQTAYSPERIADEPAN